jgi:hypothetical protein
LAFSQNGTDNSLLELQTLLSSERERFETVLQDKIIVNASLSDDLPALRNEISEQKAQLVDLRHANQELNDTAAALVSKHQLPWRIFLTRLLCYI